MTKVSIIGAGAWGTALALVAHRAGNQTKIWSPFAEEIDDVQKNHAHKLLPNCPIPQDIELTTDLKTAADADVFLFVTPAQVFRSAAMNLKPFLKTNAHSIVICSKGIEIGSSLLLSEVLKEVIPSISPSVLAGPNFAHEVAQNLPAAATLANAEESQAQMLATTLSHPNYRIYPATDVLGVELASSVKNVLAIASGLVTGAGLGENARAALISRGLIELARLGLRLGCRVETFLGMAGVGDILLTCSSTTSRNMSLGFALGQGRSMAELQKEGLPLTEGVHTVRALTALAEKHHIQMPICESVHKILYAGSTIQEEMSLLLSRPLRLEGV